METSTKIAHTILLDTGPIIKNTPSISTLLSACETLVSIPAVEDEIRDAATRSRYETTIKPFLTFRSPRPESVTVVRDFARKSGDLAVLSRPDVAILALAYELECERNGGDWRLRRAPGQKGLNGKPPQKEEAKVEEAIIAEGGEALQEEKVEDKTEDAANESPESKVDEVAQETLGDANEAEPHTANSETTETEVAAEETTKTEVSELDSSAPHTHKVTSDAPPSANPDAEDDAASDSDSEGWITPSNLKTHIEADAAGSSTTTTAPPTILQVATLTTDFAMQNVLLLMNLNLLSATNSLTRIRNLKTFVLRCHACFQVVKETSKQFCPRCGGATLTRVACSTDSQTGEFKLHLKKNMQWNTRGDRFSIPKPVAGSANMRGAGGGKGGWGKELILAEDQKEYARQVEEKGREEARRAKRDEWDIDALPGLISGDRGGQGFAPGSRIKVGAGRNVNSRRRK